MLVLSWSVAVQMGTAEAVPGPPETPDAIRGQLVDGCGAFVWSSGIQLQQVQPMGEKV